MKQLTMLGGRDGFEKIEPYAVGDVIVTHKYRRCVIETVSDNADGGVFVCVALDNGATCVVLEREIAYRSRG